MIRKMHDWWRRLRGPAVKVEYNPVLGKWRVMIRYGTGGDWYEGWSNRTIKTRFDNLTDAFEVRDYWIDKLEIEEKSEIGQWNRVISFISRKGKW